MANIQTQFLALKASAGSGKTFNLALRFIYLLFCGAKAHEILALTFTKKASNEMRHRVYKNLYELKMSFTQNTYAQNNIYKGLIAEGLSHECLSKNIHRIYKDFMQSNPRITTIDSFFYTVLKKFCWYVGVSAYFEIGNIDLDSVNEYFLDSLSPIRMDELVRFCFYNQIELKNFLSFLYYLHSLPTKDVQNALKSCMQEFDLSYEEIESRVKVAMEKIAISMDFDKRVQEYFQNNGCKGIIEKSATYLSKWGEHSYFKNKSHILSHLDAIRDEIIGLMKIYFAKREGDILKLLQSYLEAFGKALERQNRTENYLTYNDVMLKNYELFILNEQDRDFFYFRLDEKIAHILLDEFQDTSLTQYHILCPIMEEIYAGYGRIDERSLFVVGDKKQSIYMFRGSFSEVFERAIKGFTQANLPYNYRSSPCVIKFNNQVFEKCYKHYVYQQYPEHEHTIQHGYVRIFQAKDTKQSLQELVYQEVKTLLENGADENEIAILVFKNDDANFLKDYIKTQNSHIEILTQSSASLFAKNEVKILISALTYLKLKNMLKSNSNSGEEIQNALNLYERKICKLLGYSYRDSQKVIAKMNHISPLSSPKEAVFALIECFEIAQSTSMRFLELSCEYSNINDLLNAVEKIECDAPMESNNGIKIMTIHKSKGLEFKYVIVCDRMSAPRGNTDRFICSYNDVHISHIYYKTKARENFDSYYSEALQAHKERIEQEKYNVLYVAFTRAKYGLSIVQKYDESKKNKETASSGSAFDILALGNQYDELQLDSQPIQEKLNIEPINVFGHIQSFGKQSSFLRQENELYTEILNINQWYNIKFGEALHSVFELYLGYGMSKEDIQNVLFNRYGFALKKENINQAIEYVLECIQNPSFSVLMEGKELMCEVSYIVGGCLYRIDMLLYDERECYVLDYKSSAANFQKQEEQVRGYMKFLDSFNGGKKTIRGFIVYPLNSINKQLYEIH